MVNLAKIKPMAVLGAVVVNAIPILGVLFWGWSAAALMILYWMENVLIGAFNVPRIVASGFGRGAPGLAAALFTTPFFIVHYGLFCFVHGMFVAVMFGDGFGADTSGFGMFDLPQMIAAFLNQQPGLRIGVLSILVWQTFSLVFFFLLNGAYKKSDPMSQMMAPYGRIVVLHLTIIAGGMVVMALGQPLVGLLVLSLFKLGFDLMGGVLPRGNSEAQWAQNEAALRQAMRGKQAPPPAQ